MSDRGPMDRLPSAGGPLRLLSDERLVRRAAGGDQRAFAAIFQRYQSDLYRFCRAIVRDGRDAEEALQNTMVKLLRTLPGEERQIRLKPWLYRIARNEAVELLRKRREAPAIEAELPDPGPELAKTAEARERLRVLLADLAELPERQRAALVMRELSGMGFAEIGAALDTTPAVARQTVYEARLGLRQMEGGREMTCREVSWELSRADGRIARRRDIKAHLRSCPDCRAFRDAISGRSHDLAMLAPLPAAAAAALLHGALGGSAATGGGAAAGAAGAGGTAGGTGLGAGAGAAAGHAVASSAGLKALATVAVLAAGVTAADRSGLIDSPIPGGKGSTPAAHHGSAAPEQSSGGTSGTGEATTVGQGSAAGTAGEKAGKPSVSSHASPNAEGHDRGQEAGEATHGSSGELPAASQHGQETAASHGGGRAHGKSQAASHGHSHAHVHSKAGGGGSGGGGAKGGKGSGAPGQEGNNHGHPPQPSTEPTPQPEVGPDKSSSTPLPPSKEQPTKGAAPEAGGP